MRAATEAGFLDTVIRLAQLMGWRTAHFRPAMTRNGRWITALSGDAKGWPDLVLVRERLLFAELKTDKGSLRPEQKQWIEWLKAAGYTVHVWRPRDWHTIQRILARD